MVILEENFKWHLEAFASELFIYFLIFKRRYLCLHWTFSAATLQILFIHQQQHYTLFKMKKVKSQSTTPLIIFLRGKRMCFQFENTRVGHTVKRMRALPLFTGNPNLE